MPPPNSPTQPAPDRALATPPLNEATRAVSPSALSPARYTALSSLSLEGLTVEEGTEFILDEQNENVSSLSPVLPSLGDVIGEMYRVEGDLGSGAMGVVLLAVDRQLNRKVAIKLIRPSIFAQRFRERFLEEARALAEVNHPNVLSIHAFGEYRGAPYFVTEFVAGTTLDQVIAECRHAIDLGLALRIFDEICAGVAALHAAGIVHRDLKPANILLDDKFSVRVGDLGLSQKYITAHAVKELVGTIGYIAPELTLDTGTAANPRTDVYSLGCIGYELLTGEAPFRAASDQALLTLHATAKVTRPTFVRRDLPAPLDAALFRALDKDPAQRTPSVEQLRQEFQQAFAKSGEPTRILIAEDEEDFRALLERKLRAEFPDAEVEAVADGQAALDAFDRKPASVVILDLLMPILDGVAVTVRLRAHPASASVPILVLTASGGPNEWQLLSSLGADRFLVKPVDLDDVAAIVRRTVRERAQSPSKGMLPAAGSACARFPSDVTGG